MDCQERRSILQGGGGGAAGVHLFQWAAWQQGVCPRCVSAVVVGATPRASEACQQQQHVAARGLMSLITQHDIVSDKPAACLSLHTDGHEGAVRRRRSDAGKCSVLRAARCFVKTVWLSLRRLLVWTQSERVSVYSQKTSRHLLGTSRATWRSLLKCLQATMWAVKRPWSTDQIRLMKKSFVLLIRLTHPALLRLL